MEIEHFKQLVDVLSVRDSLPIRLISNSSDIRIRPNPPIVLNPNRNFECALIWFSAYNTIFNFDDSNNKFIFSHNAGINWTIITIPSGAYEIKQLNSEIQRQMTELKRFDTVNNKHYITLSVDLTRSRILIDIMHPNYQIDFNQPGITTYKRSIRI